MLEMKKKTIVISIISRSKDLQPSTANSSYEDEMFPYELLRLIVDCGFHLNYLYSFTVILVIIHNHNCNPKKKAFNRTQYSNLQVYTKCICFLNNWKLLLNYLFGFLKLNLIQQLKLEELTM